MMPWRPATFRAVLGVLCLSFALSISTAPWAVADDAAMPSDTTETTGATEPETQTGTQTENGEAAGDEAEGMTCEPHPYQIIVTVENMVNVNGLLTVELYSDNAEGFLKKAGRLERERLKATRSESEICIVAPGPGTYGVALYHDENGNEKFDKNFLGIPKEGFGISNNPGFSLGPPDFSDAAFTLGEDPVSLTIRINYL